VKINLEQRSPEWLEFRKDKIGSSAAATIMDQNKWQSKAQLWNEMKGLSEPKPVTEAMQRGIDLENDARKWADRRLQSHFIPEVHQHDQYPFLIASYDGIASKYNISSLIEIKCSNYYFEKALDRIVPDEVFTQIQHQMMVYPDIEEGFFVGYEGFEAELVRVLPDMEFQEHLLHCETEFYKTLSCEICPWPSDEREYTEVSIDKTQADLIKEWIDASSLLRTYETIEKEIRESLISLSDGNSILKYDSQPLLKLMKIEKEGNVDWKALCRSHGISVSEIEKFRKRKTEYFQLKRM
jgi:putative phage-type endonuclease